MMEKSEQVFKAGLLQMARWANNYVESETVIPEMPVSELTPDFAAALALIGALLETDRS